MTQNVKVPLVAPLQVARFDADAATIGESVPDYIYDPLPLFGAGGGRRQGDHGDYGRVAPNKRLCCVNRVQRNPFHPFEVDVLMYSPLTFQTEV